MEVISEKVVPAWYTDYFELLYLTGMGGQDARAMTPAKLDELGLHFHLFCGKSGQPLTESAAQSVLGPMKRQGHRGPVGSTWNGHDWRAATATETKGKTLGEGHTRPDIYDRDGYTAPVK